jgi:hypothetical protein
VPTLKEIKEACTALPAALPNFAFKPAWMGKNAPAINANMIQIAFVMRYVVSNIDVRGIQTRPTTTINTQPLGRICTDTIEFIVARLARRRE